MKIAYLCNAKNFYFIRWYEFFLKKGHTVYVISGDTRLRTDIMSLPKEIKVFYLPERKFKEPRISFISNLIRLPLISNKLKTILGEIKPDILHAHSLLYGLWGAKACYHPFIVTPYGSDAIIYTRK